MKKLMIAAAIVCAAVMAQASCAIGWNTNGKKFLNPTTGAEMTSYDGLVLVVMSSATDWANAKPIDTITEGVGGTTMAISSGRVSGTVKWDWTDGSAENLIDNGDYLALMYQGKNGLEQLKYYQADGKGATVDATFGPVSGISNNSYSKTSQKIMMGDAYTTAAVPEPTSALLMLLGVAGLALRRRRA